MAANLVFLAVLGLSVFALYAIFWIPYRARRDSIRAARERAEARESQAALERIWAEGAQAQAESDEAMRSLLGSPSYALPCAKPQSPYGFHRDFLGASYVISPADEAAIDRALRSRNAETRPVRTTYVTQADPIPYLETVVETIVEEVEEEVVYVEPAPVYVAPAYVAPVAVATSFAVVDTFTPSFSSSYDTSSSFDSGSSDYGSSSFD